MLERSAPPDLSALLAETPGLDAALASLLERRERTGRFPRTVTLAASPAVVNALSRLFTARAVRRDGAGRARVDLAAFLRASRSGEAELEALLYDVLGRERRDPASRERTLRAELEAGLADLSAAARSSGSRSFVTSELERLGDAESELTRRALRDGVAAALALARDVVRCIDALPTIRDPVRIQNFSARVLGSSKALRPRGDLWRAVGAALVDHDAVTRRALDEQGVPPHRTTEVARALEVNGVYHDEAAASVLCFGPLAYRKGGEEFDHVARHSRLGEASRLIVHQLRDAAFERPPARRVTVFENLTPFFDYVDALLYRSRDDEIVLCSGGQASWAVVAVLSGLARFGLPVRHSGDLDRSGVLILRSLRRRSGARVEPLFMDGTTHARFATLGQPLSAPERRRLERLVAEDSRDELCHDLLRAVLASGLWVEQEQFAEEVVEEALG